MSVNMIAASFLSSIVNECTAYMGNYQLLGNLQFINTDYSLLPHPKKLEIEFDQVNQKAYINDKKHKKNFVIETKPNIQDMAPEHYYLRNKIEIDSLNPGDEYITDMFFDKENFGFKLKYIGKEVIRTKFGKVATLKFRPYVMAGRVFKEEESLTLWVSNDKNRIPLRIKADLAIGSLRADLNAFKGLKHSFRILVE